MRNDILNHYLQFSIYTNPDLYKDILINNLPDNIEKIGLFVRKQIIHRVTLKNGNVGSNKDLRYGNMTKVPWYQQCQDDVLPTAPAMLAELYRRDKRGFVMDRSEPNKLILTCRFISILMASILKSKGIPCRVRSGFAPYFNVSGLPGEKSDDHWINQYWNQKETRWVTIDVDGSLEGYLKFNPYDMSQGVFDFSADAWLNVRRKKIDGEHFWNAGGFSGLITVAWELFYDFHCLMNHEIIYFYHPNIVMLNNFKTIGENELKEIDELAVLMQNSDDNFDQLKNIWNNKRKYRLLSGGLL